LEFVFLVFGILILGILSKDNNIKNFTGADIEKYHKGLLSAKERHDLEKAALEDTFLADALEGYAVAGVNHSADMDELKKRLSEKVEAGKVIVMKPGVKTLFPWLRVAALVIIVGCLGVLANQFLFNNKKSGGIAKLEDSKPKETKASDTDSGIVSTTNGTLTTTTKENTPASATGQQQNERTITITQPVSGKKDGPGANGLSKTKEPAGDVVTVNPNITPGNAPSPVKINDQEKIKLAEKDAGIKEVTREETKPVAIIKNKGVIDKDADGVADKFEKQQGEDLKKKNAVAANRKAADEQPNAAGYLNQSNTFRGRVTDTNNVGLPFARVYNPTDNNAGTYTDVAGNFNLTYPDSILTVQVKSVGFENTNVQLRNTVANNQVILQDDRSLAAQTIPAPRKINAEERSKMVNVKLEEPEPADGWDNYDTYIVNNLNPPEEIKTRQNAGGQVEVSFEVDKNGNPVNIRVEKSLCKKCDAEAIRLIKEGPKWKRNTKKGRTTVTVPFNNSL
jgi:TonB family protein